MVIENPLYLQTKEYSARHDRFLTDYLLTEGVTNVPAGELRVTQRAGGGPTMSVDVAAGTAVVDGDDTPNQGAYLVRVTAAENIAVTAPPASNSRIDLVVLRVYDSTATGGDPGIDGAALEVVQGVAAPSPTVPATPPTALVLARVTVAAGAVSILDANIADQRVQVGKAEISLDRTDLQTFTTSGVWTKPTGAALVAVTVIGGGGAGGSPAENATYGGGGGGGAVVVPKVMYASALGATEVVTVGAGGVPQLATFGVGGTGGTSSFGSYISAYGGGGGRHTTGSGAAGGGAGTAGPGQSNGQGGTPSAAGPGGVGGAAGHPTTGMINTEYGGAGGGSQGGAGGNPGGSSLYSAAGGGGGGSTTSYPGAAGGTTAAYVPGGGGAAGAASSTATSNGAAGGRLQGGGGGGCNVAGPFGFGGGGGIGGGGGGGASRLAGYGSSLGGAGGRGEVVVLTLCL